MKRLIQIAALVAAFITAPICHAQSWTVGDQGADWSVIPSSYPVGAQPADAYEPAEIADTFTETDWFTTEDQLTTSRGVAGNFLIYAADGERKLRFTCVPSGPILAQDFILRNMSHLHGGFGFTNWDQNSGYASVRAAPNSSCVGGPLLSQIYIEPQMMKVLSNGALVGVRALLHSVYYVEGTQANPVREATWLRRGTKFILGANPNNYNDAARRAVYAAAGRAYPGSPDTPAGFEGWQCFKSDGSAVAVTLVKAQLRSRFLPDDPSQNDIYHARYLWGSGPTDDPWGGNCVPGTGGPGYATIIGNLQGPRCWDGMNLESPDGRGHMWYAGVTLDNATKDICPKTTLGVTYAKVPEPFFKSTYTTSGPDDYKQWYLTSDRMNAPGTAADATSLDECRKTGPYFCNGSTFHADWGYGAQSKFFDEGQRQCLDIVVRGVAPTYAGGAECDSGTYSRFKTLKTGASPNSALSAGCAVILGCFDPIPSKPKDRYIAIPKQLSGSTKVHRGMTM